MGLIINSEGLLSPGRHIMTFNEVYQKFVVEAPCATERSEIWEWFTLWVRSVKNILPEAKLWINGGFVTYKEVAPKDIDVVIITNSDNIKNNQIALVSLLTDNGSISGIRRQPAGGKVDAFICDIENDSLAEYWDNFWQSVKGIDQNIIDNLQKGYVEVSLND